MKFFQFGKLMGLVVALALTLGMAGMAHADASSDKAAVDAAKAQGIVGEQGDGYLGIRGTASAEVKAAVANINKGRAGVYAQAAAEAGTTPQAAGEGQAKTIFSKMPAGQYFKPLGGDWIQK